jgi:HSP20 family protein
MANIVTRRNPAPLAARSPEGDPFESMRQLLQWDPFQELARRFRGEAGGGMFVPAFDVKEEKDAFVFKADLPGIRESDLDISVTGQRLSISGKREEETVSDQSNYYCLERSYGSFSRTFTLPDSVNADQIQAEMRDGVLTLRVPKSPEAQPKKIAIRPGSGGGPAKAKA